MSKRRIVLSLDVSTLDEAASLADKLADEVGCLKIGSELFAALGPSILRIGHSLNLDVMLDLKLHDIPETVEQTIRVIASHGIKYLTIHSSGGPEMLRRAVAAAPSGLQLLAITVLTSLNSEDLRTIGFSRLVSDQVPAMARMAWESGIRGFICSPLEVSSLRAIFGSEALLVVVGTRKIGSNDRDQKRVSTPYSAVRAGANMLIIGKNIYDSPDPVSIVRSIADDIDSATRSDSVRPVGV